MIGDGVPEDHRELAKAKVGETFYSKTSRLLHVKQENGWTVLGMVVAVDAPLMNRPLRPRLQGHPY